MKIFSPIRRLQEDAGHLPTNRVVLQVLRESFYNSLVKTKEIKKPKKYQKPQIQSEKLLAFAASCNGTPKGGRKVSVSGPVNFCRANRLNS